MKCISSVSKEFSLQIGQLIIAKTVLLSGVTHSGPLGNQQDWGTTLIFPQNYESPKYGPRARCTARDLLIRPAETSLSTAKGKEIHSYHK